MSISSEHYNTILREYDQKQFTVQRELSERREAVYARLPRIREIHNRLSGLQVEKARLRLSQNAYTLEAINREISALSAERDRLLAENGYAPDHLEPHYFCKDCRDTGYTAQHRMCHCFKQALIDVMYDQSNIKTLLKTCSFKHFRPDYYDDTEKDPQTGKTARENILETRRYCDRFIEEFSSHFRNLLFYGETGVGKSFLSLCIAKELLERSFSVLYLSAIDFASIMSESVFNARDMSSETKETLHFIYDCDLLILDDLGTEVTNSIKSSHLFHCLDKRLQNRRAVIINTNLSPREISRIYSDRIFSRIIGNYTCFKIFGDDIRKKQKL